ncbi:UvrD-helicase domain-containing protein [Baekduia sp.]|jgi:ATP-dependent exoDNAse (exonuclease V) beta subunit|uniref:UvrD-helicase domain-containing protein n=1 Tax=Baekduia sp. TaxID=2600305 RepID=UPI002E03E011|nr:UvrD-helicase domain-containing protein [Baekduia sp.]
MLYDDGRMVGRGGLPFTDEQAEAIARREGSLLLSANAGSGKTSVLSERFVRLVLEDDVAPGRILAITFTDKAAGELRTRVRGRFVELGRRDRARDLDAAWISTFHGLCARILRAHAVRAGLDPAFTVLEEAEARDIRGTAFERALADFLSDDRAETLDLVAAYGVDALQLRITTAHDQLRSSGMTRPRLPEVRVTPPDPAALAAALERAEEELVPGDERPRIATARAALASCQELLSRLNVGPPTPPPALAALEAAAFKPGNMKALQGDGCAAYLEALDAFAGAWRDALAAAAIVLLDELLVRYAEAYAEGKRARAALDFDDLELLARDLLRDTPAIRASYAERFERVMVDEFQDTNATQLSLLELLGTDRFVVGDELQSIYSFRHADVRIFRAQRAELARAGAAAELAANFRSRPDILGVLDAAMGPLHGAAHVPFVAAREDPVSPAVPLVELLLTDAEAVEAWPPELLASLPHAAAKRRAEARVVAARIAELVRGEGVPASDIVVLLRAATDMAVFERAIEEQGLATLAAGGRGYWGRQQVLDLCAYLGALANPRDELALLGLLASPLVGLGADGLAILARTARPGARWDALTRAFSPPGERAADDSHLDVASQRPGAIGGDRALCDLLPDADRDALANFCPWFAAERQQAPRRGLDVLLERVVDRTGYDLHVLGLPGGRRRWANVLKLQRLAAGFEGRRGRDVRGLIDLATAELEAQARETDAPVELGDATAIRLMTMHAAKGLEFPVVVIADLGRSGRNDTDDLLVREGRVGLRLRTIDGASAKTLEWEALRTEQQTADLEEERRILHVAMTRAEERLILSGTFDPDKWLGAPQPAVAPLRWLAPRLVAGLEGVLADAADAVPTLGDPDPSAPRDRVAVRVHREPPPEVLATPVPIAAEASGPGVPEPTRESTGGQLALDLFAAPEPPPRRVYAEPPPPGGPVDGRPASAEGPAGAEVAQPPPGGPAGGRPASAEGPTHAVSAARAVAAAPPRPLPATLSYTSLAAYDRCAYRWYLERILRLPRDDSGGPATVRAERPAGPIPDGLDALTRGSLAHVLLEHLDFAAPAAPSEEAVREAARLMEAELTDADVTDLQALVAAFADGPLAARLAAAIDVRREHGFVVGLGDDSAPLLNGVIDVIAFEDGGGALVVDYKSDVVTADADLEAYVEADYGAQRRIYALAALGAGAADVEVAHLFLARPAEPATVVYDRNDLPRLREELDELVAGIAAGQFTPTTQPHRTLCLTCPGRRALCHHPEELTLREEPTPVV